MLYAVFQLRNQLSSLAVNTIVTIMMKEIHLEKYKELNDVLRKKSLNGANRMLDRIIHLQIIKHYPLFFKFPHVFK